MLYLADDIKQKFVGLLHETFIKVYIIVPIYTVNDLFSAQCAKESLFLLNF